KLLEATDCHIIVTLDLLAPSVVGSLGHGPLEHVIVASLARQISPVRGWLYRIERLRRNGPFALRENDHVHHFDHLLRHGGPCPDPRLVPEEDVAVLSPTGGTTSSPKAVMLTHRNLIGNAFQL